MAITTYNTLSSKTTGGLDVLVAAAILDGKTPYGEQRWNNSTAEYEQVVTTGALTQGAKGDTGAAGAGSTVRSAAGVPSSAPTGTEAPIAFDSTPSTGGLYCWNGSAWVKASTIPA